MKRAYKCASSVAAAILAVGFSVAWAPASRAADDPPAAPSSAAAQPAAASPAPAQPASSSSASSETQQRLADLEKEVSALQAEISALKESESPGMRTAAYVQPAAVSDPLSAPADDAAQKISISSLLGPVTLSGFGDVYYGYDYNHPEDNMSGLRFFEAPTNGFSFNMAEVILDKPPDATSAESRLGYHVSAGYGQAAKIVNGSDTAFTDGSNFYVKEAYFDYLAPIGKGLTVTVGKFVTPIGAEVIESNANWNYSRSLLFYYAIPYFHFGASAKYVFNPKFALTGYLVNGWNNTIIDHYVTTGLSSGLTYGVSLAWTPTAKWAVTENYFAGPVIDAYNYVHAAYPLTDWKQLSDTVIAYTPNTKWAFQINGDYGFGPRYYFYKDESGAPTSQSPTVNWWGIAGYAKYTWTPKTNFAVRYEYYDDTNGYTGLLTGSYSGDRGFAQEVTGTWSYNLTTALLIRGEYRYDFASKPIFAKSTDGFVKEQNTATLSFVYAFSSANLK